MTYFSLLKKTIFFFSLRAIYGKDLVHNAIEVSSTVEQAQNDIHLIFGDLDREEQGKKRKKKALIQIKEEYRFQMNKKKLFSFFKNLVYMKSKSIDNSLSGTPDLNDELVPVDTDAHEGDCNRYCTSMSYSLYLFLHFY